MPHPSPRAVRLLLPFALFALPGLAAAQQPADARLTAFLHQGPAEQQRLHDELLALLATRADATERALAVLAGSAATPVAERTERLAVHAGKRLVAADEAADTKIPQTMQYVFGVGAIEALDHAASPPARKPEKSAADKAAAEHAAAETRRAQRAAAVEQALLGITPGADRALAALLRQLDTDSGGDHFAAFLHAWRNGKESFYEALDRTAGTKDSVFFYDAMIGDFRSTFASDGPVADRLGRSLQQAHDALHDAFLAYRQYRGFREAVAWSCILPPDVPLPRRLARYENRSPGGYSLRQQVVMVLAVLDDDPQRLAAEIVRTSPALGQPLWRGSYDPYPPWREWFAALVPKMLEQAANTDAFLATVEQRRRDAAAAITAAAHQVLDR